MGGSEVVREERLLNGCWDRIREIVQGSYDLLYLRTEYARILRIAFCRRCRLAFIIFCV